MYESPIILIEQQIASSLDNDIFKMIVNIGVDVDKGELIRALQYDRNQYEKGYADAKAELVRCEDCSHRGIQHEGVFFCHYDKYWHSPSDFCSYGERD